MEIIHILKRDLERVFGEKITKPGRNTREVNSKVAFSYICKNILKLTLEEIGTYMNRDHSTIRHHIKNFDDFYNFDNNFKKKFNKLDLDDYKVTPDELLELKIDRLEFRIKKLKSQLSYA